VIGHVAEPIPPVSWRKGHRWQWISAVQRGGERKAPAAPPHRHQASSAAAAAGAVRR
jgi:hypothetical protein